MNENLLAVGGALGAVAASTCCIVPLALTTVGVGGAWIGALTAMAPYQPIFLAVAVACLGVGFWLVYGRRQAVCTTTGRVLGRVLWVKGALWFGAAVSALAVAIEPAARLLS